MNGASIGIGIERIFKCQRAQRLDKMIWLNNLVPLNRSVINCTHITIPDYEACPPPNNQSVRRSHAPRGLAMVGKLLWFSGLMTTCLSFLKTRSALITRVPRANLDIWESGAEVYSACSRVKIHPGDEASGRHKWLGRRDSSLSFESPWFRNRRIHL